MGQNLLSAVALMLVIEGILPFVNPQALRRSLARLTELDDRTFRISGLMSMLIGAGLLYLVRHLAET